jgi:O-acetyl-ADP-ribose deacetylase (regulator of RNase III)
MSNPLIDAARASKNTLAIGEGVLVPLENESLGSLGARSVMVVCPPYQRAGTDQKKLESELEETYETIFALLASSAPKSNEKVVLSLPCFSTGEGGVSPDVSARIAMAKAKAFLEQNDNKDKFSVRVVCYTDNQGKQNKKAFEKALKNVKDLPVEVVKGDITQGQFTGVVVMPIRENYNLEISGPTAKKIAELASKKMKELKTYKALPEDKDFGNPQSIEEDQL